MRIRQLFVDAHGCGAALNDGDAIARCVTDAATAVGATVLSTHTEVFQPHGVTCVVILGESHVIVTTWPEHAYAGIDILLCNDDMEPGDVAAPILELLEASDVAEQVIRRQIGPGI